MKVLYRHGSVQPRTRLDVSDTNSGSTLDMQPQQVHLGSGATPRRLPSEHRQCPATAQADQSAPGDDLRRSRTASAGGGVPGVAADAAALTCCGGVHMSSCREAPLVLPAVAALPPAAAAWSCLAGVHEAGDCGACGDGAAAGFAADSRASFRAACECMPAVSRRLP